MEHARELRAKITDWTITAFLEKNRWGDTSVRRWCAISIEISPRQLDFMTCELKRGDKTAKYEEEPGTCLIHLSRKITHIKQRNIYSNQVKKYSQNLIMKNSQVNILP